MYQFKTIKLHKPRVKLSRFKFPKIKPGIPAMSMLVCVILLILVGRASGVAAQWWNESWLYRLPVSIANAGFVSLTEYQVKLAAVDTTQLVTDGKLNSDCSDIRFTNATGKPLSYYIADQNASDELLDCATNDYDIWVKVDKIDAGGTTIYMYYGNKQSASGSNGENTFEFFDGFANGSLDAGKWNSSGSSTLASGTIALDNSEVLVSKSRPTDASGLGRLIFRAKQAATNLTGGKVGFSNTSTTSTHYNNDDAANLVAGSTEEQVNATASTNLVSHYQLEETTSTDVNQFKSSGYYDTGKLSQAVSMYGNAAGTQGSTLTFNAGSQISGNNYEHFNTNQGSISFWVKPSWNGNDNLEHYFFDGNIGAIASSFRIYKSTGNNLIFEVNNGNNRAISSSISSWTSGTWYHVIVTWDADASTAMTLYVNTGSVGTPVAGPITITHSTVRDKFIGSNYSGTSQAQALIDDFAVYDRVLTTTEIASLYNSGTGNEAGYVADPSLKFYAKLDGSGTLAPVTYNAGASASKLTATNSELTGGVNIISNGNFESGTTGWIEHATPTTFEAATTNVIFDTKSMHVIGDGLYDGVQRIITVSPSTNYHLTAWGKKISGVNVRWELYTNNGDSVTFVDNYSAITSSDLTKLETDFKTPYNTTSIILKFHQVSAGTIDFYIDNVSLTPNLVDNGGMEGTYSDVADSTGTADLAPGWTISGIDVNDNLAEETTNIHSGSKSQKIVASAANRGVYQNWNHTQMPVGNYLFSAWVKVVYGTVFMQLDNSGGDRNVMSSSTSWTRLSFVTNKTTTSGAYPLLKFFSAYDVANFYVDDVSVIPLDNVATAFKAWTPVMDTPGANSTELLSNTGFETPGGGGVDVFANWLEGAGTGTLVQVTTSNNGTSAVKLTGSADFNTAIYQRPTVKGNTSYTVSFSTRGDGSSIGGRLGVYDITNGAWIVMPTLTNINGTSYSRYSYTFTTPATCTTAEIDLWAYGAGTVAYFDDVSIKETANPLSVQGNPASGVTSTASGARGNAYTFDGSTGYLRQKTYDVNVGTLTYQDTSTDISDDGQEFEDWDNDNAGSAEYMIVVTNSDNTTSWGYFCADDGGTQTAVYTLKACTGGAEGFNGTSPSGKTPVGYEIRKTDYQLTSSFSAGAWVKTSTSYAGTILSKHFNLSGANNMSWYLKGGAGYLIAFISRGTGQYPATYNLTWDSNWHFVSMVYTSSTSLKLYYDGQEVASNTSSIPSTINDVSYPLLSYALLNSAGGMESNPAGSIDSPFVLSSALTADQIKDIYNSTASHYGIITNNETVNGTAANSATPTTDTSYHTYSVTSGSASSWFVQDQTTIATDTTNLPNEDSYVRVQNTDATNALTLDWIAAAKEAATEPAGPAVNATYISTNQQTQASVETKGAAPVAFWPLSEGTYSPVGNYAKDVTSHANEGGAPVLWLTMDDNDIDAHSCPGGGTAAGACDVSGNGNNATANGTMTDSDYVSGKIGPKALDFDGTDDSLMVSGLLGSPQTITLSAWVSLDNQDTSGAEVISLGDNAAIRIENNKIWGWFYSGTTWPGISYTTAMQATGWHHIVYTFDLVSHAQKLYFDGRLVNSGSETTAISYTSGGTNTYVGRHANSGVNWDYDGQIDEVKVFNYAQTEEQIKADFENTHAYFAGGSSSPTWSQSGVIPSQAEESLLSFDGIDDYLTVADNSKLDIGTNDFSIGGWVKLTDNGQVNSTIVEKRLTGSPYTGYILYFQDTGDCGTNQIRFQVNAGTLTDNCVAAGYDIRDNKWHYISVTVDRDSATGGKYYLDGNQIGSSQNFSSQTASIANTANLYIGRSGQFSNDFSNGSISGVKIFNYALSANQVKTQYSAGIDGKGAGTGEVLGGDSGKDRLASLGNGLVGYWKLDGDANDSSGNNNNGTLAGNTSYVAGKLGQACTLDGTSDYVEITDSTGSVFDITNQLTISAWVYVDTQKTYNTIWRKQNAYSFIVNSSGQVVFETYHPAYNNYTATSKTVSATSWVNVLVIFDNTIASNNKRVYINGELAGSTSVTGALSTNDSNIQLGDYGGSYRFDGKVDDIRVYNRALNDDEVSELFQNGNGPIASYNMNENTGVTAGDSSGYNNNLTKASNVILSENEASRWVPGQEGSAVNLDGADDSYQTSDNRGGLVGWWKMDEASWNGTAGEVIDSSGNANNGVRSGDATTSATSKFGRAGTFDGTDDYVNAGNNSSLDIGTGNASIALWVKYSVAQNEQYDGHYIGALAGKGYLVNSAGQGIYIYDNKINYAARTVSTVYSATSNSTLNDGIWHYCVGVLDRSNSSGIKLYIDGIAQTATGNGSALSGVDLSNSLNFTVGSREDIAHGYMFDYKGSLDDVRLYNRALSANEIKDLYNQSKLSPTGSVSLSADVKPKTIDSGSASGMTAGGVVAAKGENYNLSAVADDAGNISSAFSTNAITTQLSGTSINDVYFYDTTKDSVDSSWRFDSTKSWYTETIDATYRNCDPATHDRCGSQEFPEKAYIVATATKVYIFDAQENAMWMRFDQNYSVGDGYGITSILGSIYLTNSSVFVLNGKIYIVASGNGDEGGLRVADIRGDTAKWYSAYASHPTYGGDWSTTIANRNGRYEWSTNTVALVNRAVNDVHAAVVSGKTYVAVATDGGLSLINETDRTVVSSNADQFVQGAIKIFLLDNGNMYVKNKATSTRPLLFVSNVTSIATNFTPTTAYWSDSSPSMNNYSQSGEGGSLYVTKGTSTIDGTSNTVYLSFSNSPTGKNGIVVLQEKQADATNGSVKYLTKDYITEEMIGDIRGMWPLNGSGDISANANISDSSVKSTTLTAPVAFTGGNGYVSGVRGTGVQFNGSTNYLCTGTGGTCAENTNINFTGSHSISIWVKPSATAFSNNGYLFRRENAYKAVFNTNGTIVYSTKANGACGSAWIDVTSNYIFPTTSWTFVTFVYDGTNEKIYINGVLDNNFAVSGSLPSCAASALGIGICMTTGGTTCGQYYVGQMDELTMTAEALTADQIKHMYEVGKKALQNQGTSALNGSSNQVNAVAASGLSPVILSGSEGSRRVTTSTLFAGTEGGGVSVIDLASDTLMKAYTTASTPAINHANVNALTATTDGNFIAALDSGMSRLNGVSGSTNLSTTNYTNIAGVYDQTDVYYKLFENGVLVGKTYVSTSHAPPTNSSKLVVGGVLPAAWTIDADSPSPTQNFFGAIDNVNLYDYGSNSREVNLDYGGGTGQPVVYLPFEEGAGPITKNRNWQASGTTTNLVPNPSFETGVGAWYDYGGNSVISQVTTESLYGSGAGKLVGATDYAWSRPRYDGISVSASTTYTLSVWVKGGTGSTGKAVLLAMVGNNSGETTSGNTNLTTGWQKMTLSKTTNANDTTLDVAIPIYNDTSGFTFYFDGFQLEAVSSATPYCDGSLDNIANGTYTWSGTAHASTSTCTYGADGTLMNGVTWQNDGAKGKSLRFDGVDDYVVTSPDIMKTPAAVSVSGWFKTGAATNGKLIFSIEGYYAMYLHSGQLMPFFDGSSGGNSSYGSGLNDNQWHHFVAMNNGTTTMLYVDGKSLASFAETLGNIDTLSDEMGIGSQFDGELASCFSGDIDEIKVFPYALTPSEIKVEYNLGAGLKLGSATTSKTQGSATKGEESGLVGYWKMDEASWAGLANEVIDSSGNGNHGISVGGVATTTATSKFGRAGDFNGATARVRCATNASTFNPGSSAHSFSAWVKPTAYTNVYNYIVAIGNDSVGQQSSFGIKNDGTLFVSAYTTPIVTTTYAIPSLNNWYHISMVYNNGTAYFYVNGSQVESKSISLSTTTGKCTIGSNLTESSYNFTGQIDDVKIYNRALSSAEVRNQYYFGPAPVAQWKFDENDGTTAYDASGNGNTGTLTNGPAWVPGKKSSALSLNGVSSQYVNVGDNPSVELFNSFTISARIKTSTTGAIQAFVSKWGSSNGAKQYNLSINDDNTILFAVMHQGPTMSWMLGTTTVTDGNWHQITAINDVITNKLYVYVDGKLDNSVARSSSNALQDTSTPLRIGEEGDGNGAYYTGSIDDVNIYNYALTPYQIAKEYNDGGPVGFWKLNEGEGQTATDSSGQGNDGILGSSSADTTGDPDWVTDQASCKQGRCLSFNGTDDYACSSANGTCVDNNKLDITGNTMTVSAWIKRNGGTGAYRGIVNKSDFYYDATGYRLHFDTNNKIAFRIGNSGTTELTGNTSITDSNWHLIIGIYDGTNLYIYIDGKLDKQTPASGNIADSSKKFYIGANYYNNAIVNYFIGQIDDVKVFNYALSVDDVAREYNLGAAVKF